MTRRFVIASLTMAFVVSCCIGCGGGNTVTKGTTPVTGLAPSEPTNYGNTNKPPNPKDLLKGKIPEGKMPPIPGKK